MPVAFHFIVVRSPKNIMGILGSCKQNPSGSDVGFPSSITVRTVQCKWEGLLETCSTVLVLVQCSGRGSEPTRLDLIIRSAANCDNRNSRRNRLYLHCTAACRKMRWVLTAGDKSSWNFSKQGAEGGLGSVICPVADNRDLNSHATSNSLELTL